MDTYSLTAAQKREEQAARNLIRSALADAFGTKIAYTANLYHRSDGWYYQPHGDQPEHLGSTAADVAAELRQIAIIRQIERWH